MRRRPPCRRRARRAATAGCGRCAGDGPAVGERAAPRVRRCRHRPSVAAPLSPVGVFSSTSVGHGALGRAPALEALAPHWAPAVPPSGICLVVAETSTRYSVGRGRRRRLPPSVSGHALPGPTCGLSLRLRRRSFSRGGPLHLLTAADDARISHPFFRRSRQQGVYRSYRHQSILRSRHLARGMCEPIRFDCRQPVRPCGDVLGKQPHEVVGT